MSAVNRKLEGLIRGLQACQVAVIGDVMLDHYVKGNADRLSPEAPIQVLDVTDEFQMPGGAANVAMKVVGLESKVRMVGLIGGDRAAADLQALLASHPDVTDSLIVDPGRSTTVKTRFIAHNQQLLRVDRERRITPTGAGPRAAGRGRPCGGVRGRRRDPGRLRQGRALPRGHRRGPGGGQAQGRAGGRRSHRARLPPVCRLDRPDAQPQGGRQSPPSGRSRTWRASRPPRTCWSSRPARPWRSLARPKASRCSAAASRASPIEHTHVPTVPVAVYDVTGAGDAVAATLAISLASGTEMADACALANLAGRAVVRQFGVGTISPAHLLAEASSESADWMVKVADAASARQRAREIKQAGGKVVFTNGCFDILHYGHAYLLQFSRSQGDFLILGLNTDSSVRRFKGPSRPYVSEDQRAYMLSLYPFVDLIVMFNEDTPLNLIEAIRPDVLVKGGDYTPETVVGRDIVESYGGRVAICPRLEGLSTTDLVRKIQDHAAAVRLHAGGTCADSNTLYGNLVGVCCMSPHSSITEAHPESPVT